jgi:hypothetical protein
MAHPNRLYSGDFARDLGDWSPQGDAVHVVNQGYGELGAVSLPTPGSAVEQAFSIGLGRAYMVEVAVCGAAADGELSLAIETAGGELVYASTLLFSDSAWSFHAERVGLAWGDYNIRLACVAAACYVDDVSIAYVEATRQELARKTASRLGALAETAGFSPGATQLSAEGDYTDAIDEGLRAIGALDPAGRPDVRYVEADSLSALLGAIELAMLNKLQRYWITKTTYQLGPRTEYMNQIQAALLALTGGAVGGRPASAGRGVQTRTLHHEDKL